MITECPHCHAALDVPDSAHTQRGLECPACGKGFLAAAGMLFPCGEEIGDGLSPRKIACPFCGQHYDASQLSPGKVLLGCVSCAGVFAVPPQGSAGEAAAFPPPDPEEGSIVPPPAPGQPPAPSPAAPPGNGTGPAEKRSPWTIVRSILGNLLWLWAGGLASALSMALYGLLLCVTIIGIPFGIQFFKLARLSLSPFGAEVVQKPSAGCLSVGFNILWILMGGWIPALLNLFVGLVFFITVIGIPFAAQYFKLAKLMLTPFGMEVRRIHCSWLTTILCSIAVIIIDMFMFFSDLRSLTSTGEDMTERENSVSLSSGAAAVPEPVRDLPVRKPKPKAKPEPKPEPPKPKIRKVVDRVSDPASGDTYLLMDEPEKDKVRRLKKKTIKPIEEIFIGDDGTVYKIMQ